MLYKKPCPFDATFFSTQSCMMSPPTLPTCPSICCLTPVDFMVDVLLAERDRFIGQNWLTRYQIPTPTAFHCDNWATFLGWSVSPFSLRTMPPLVHALCMQATIRAPRYAGLNLASAQRRSCFLLALVEALSRPWHLPIGVADYSLVLSRIAFCMDVGAYLCQRFNDDDEPPLTCSMINSYADFILEAGALHAVYARQPGPMFIHSSLSNPQYEAEIFKSPFAAAGSSHNDDTQPSNDDLPVFHLESHAAVCQRENPIQQGFPPEAFGLFNRPAVPLATTTACHASVAADTPDSQGKKRPRRSSSSSSSFYEEGCATNKIPRITTSDAVH